MGKGCSPRFHLRRRHRQFFIVHTLCCHIPHFQNGHTLPAQQRFQIAITQLINVAVKLVLEVIEHNQHRLVPLVKLLPLFPLLLFFGNLRFPRLHLRSNEPIIRRTITFLQQKCVGTVLGAGGKSLLTASAESACDPLNYSLASKYEFVLWGDGISTYYDVSYMVSKMGDFSSSHQNITQPSPLTQHPQHSNNTGP